MKRKNIIIVLTILVKFVTFAKSEYFKYEMFKDEEMKNMTGPEIIEFYKYPSEIHSVTTQDGYILELHRIPNPGKPPVLLGHGFNQNSVDFMLSGPDNALAFLLFDQGFDVWMMNFRGNRYSRKHKTLNPDKDPEFWNFSLHESAVYDLRTGIDHVLNQSYFDKLSYIGYSLATSYFFILSSELPEYDQKINSMIGLSPVLILRNPKSLIFQHILKIVEVIELFPYFLSSPEFLSTKKNNNSSPLFKSLMMPIFNDIFGPDPTLFEDDFLDQMLAHSPSGTSIYVFIHTLQIFRANRFQRFDYGPIGNLMKYNSLIPPKYDTTRSKIPKFIFYSKNDNIVSVEDAERIPDYLSNLVKLVLVPEENFNHLDFLFSRHAETLIYDDIFQILDKCLVKC